MALWSMGCTRGAMSWQPSGSGLVRASRLIRAFSARSPVKRRYRVPLRPRARRARSSRRGVHQAHSAVQATSHSSATAAAAPASAHGEASRSIKRARAAIGVAWRGGREAEKESGSDDSVCVCVNCDWERGSCRLLNTGGWADTCASCPLLLPVVLGSLRVFFFPNPR